MLNNDCNDKILGVEQIIIVTKTLAGRDIITKANDEQIASVKSLSFFTGSQGKNMKDAYGNLSPATQSLARQCNESKERI